MSYDTLVIFHGGGVFTHFITLACVPTQGKLSLILDRPFQTQLSVDKWLVRERCLG